AHNWTLQGHEGGVYCVGVGGSLTGRRADAMIIDDPVKDQAAAESETQRNALWKWFQQTGRTRLSPGGFIVVIMTRWHEDDLVGRLLANNVAGWEVLRVPALADHRPEMGEVDP